MDRSLEKLEYSDYFLAFKMYKTILEMMKDRGYQITGDQNITINTTDSSAEIERLLENGITYSDFFEPIVFSDQHSERKCFVNFFLGGERNKEIAEVIGRNAGSIENSENYSQVIVVDGSTEKKLSKLKSYIENGQIRVFTVDSLIYNPTRHFLVPRFDLVANAHSLNIHPDKIPRLLRDDPIAKYYDFRPGNIVRITQRYEYIPGVIGTIIYRLVV